MLLSISLLRLYYAAEQRNVKVKMWGLIYSEAPK